MGGKREAAWGAEIPSVYHIKEGINLIARAESEVVQYVLWLWDNRTKPVVGDLFLTSGYLPDLELPDYPIEAIHPAPWWPNGGNNFGVLRDERRPKQTLCLWHFRSQVIWD